MTTSDAEPELLAQLEQQRQDLAADRGVEAGDRLVGDQQLRLERERAGDQHPLPLAARQLVRVAQEERLGRTQPGRRQGGGDQLGLARPGLRDQLVDAQALGDRLVDGVPRVERAERVLEHELDVAPERLQPRGRSGRAAPPPAHLAGGRRRAGRPACGPASSCRSPTRRPAPRPRRRGRPGRRRRGRGRPGRCGSRTRPARPRADSSALACARSRSTSRHVADPDAGGLAGPRRTSRARGSAGRHTSAARGQRGANEQPCRQVARVGRVAGQPGRREAGGRVADPRERRGQRAGVGVQRRRRRPASAGPVSTTRPAYITGDPVAQVGEHREVVADHHHPDAAVADQVGQHVEHLGLHHHVERGGRLVGDDQLGVAGQRHRDHHPLLLAAGELVGVACGRGRGRARPARAARRRAPAPRLGQPRLVHLDRLGDLAPIRCTGLSECSAPWNTIEAPAQRTARSSPQRMRQDVVARRSSTSPVTVALGGCSRRMVLASVDLPQPDSPATPTIWPRSHGQVDTAHGGQPRPRRCA